MFKDEVYAIIGAAMEVHNEMNAGYPEAVYQECMEIELSPRGIPLVPQKQLTISYKGRILNKYYIADVVCFGRVLVELKAMSQTTSREEAQLLGYLKATGLRVGLLINFGDPIRLDWHRFVL